MKKILFVVVFCSFLSTLFSQKGMNLTLLRKCPMGKNCIPITGVDSLQYYVIADTSFMLGLAEFVIDKIDKNGVDSLGGQVIAGSPQLGDPTVNKTISLALYRQGQTVHVPVAFGDTDRNDRVWKGVLTDNSLTLSIHNNDDVVVSVPVNWDKDASDDLQLGTTSGTALEGDTDLTADDLSDNTTDDLPEGSTNLYSKWLANGQHIYNSNTGNVGIGTNNITEKLQVDGNVVAETYLAESNPNQFISQNVLTKLANLPAGDTHYLGYVDGFNAFSGGMVFYVSSYYGVSTWVVGGYGNYNKAVCVTYKSNFENSNLIRNIKPVSWKDSATGFVHIGVENANTGASISFVTGFKLDLLASNRTRKFVKAVNTNLPTGFTNQMAYSIGGGFVSNSKYILGDSTTQVGIKTDFPSQALDINGNLRLRERLYDSSNSSGFNLEILSSIGTGTEWKSISELGLTPIWSKSGNTSYYLNSVAIGANSITDYTGTNLGIHANVGSASRIKFTNSVTGTTNAALGGSIVYDTGLNFDIANRSVGDMRFWTSNIVRMFIAENGFVGINNSTPSTHLHVNGGFRLNYQFYDKDGEAGILNQKLISVGTGVDWVDDPPLSGNESVFDGWDKDASDDLQLGTTSGTALEGDTDLTADDLSDNDTDDLSEGVGNLYFTEPRVNATPLVSNALQPSDFGSNAGQVSEGNHTHILNDLSDVSVTPVHDHYLGYVTGLGWISRAVAADSFWNHIAVKDINVAGHKLNNVGGYDQTSGNFDVSTTGSVDIEATSSNPIIVETTTSDIILKPKGVIGTLDQRVALNATGGIKFVAPISDTDDVTEGSTNRYFSDALVEANSTVSSALQWADTLDTPSTLNKLATKADLENSGDNLGNHTATEHVEMGNYRLNQVAGLSFFDIFNPPNNIFNFIVNSAGLVVDGATNDYNFNPNGPQSANDLITVNWFNANGGGSGGGGSETDPIFSASAASNITSSGSNLVITALERDSLNSALQPADVSTTVVDGDGDPVSGDAVHAAIEGLGGGGADDNMGIGFIVSKVGIGNTTIDNSDLGGVPYAPLLRLGENLTYSTFDSGRSVDIDVTLDGNGVEDGEAVAGGKLDMANFKVENVATPTNGGDAVNKTYVDDLKLTYTTNEKEVGEWMGVPLYSKTISSSSLSSGSNVLVHGIMGMTEVIRQEVRFNIGVTAALNNTVTSSASTISYTDFDENDNYMRIVWNTSSVTVQDEGSGGIIDFDLTVWYVK